VDRGPMAINSHGQHSQFFIIMKRRREFGGYEEISNPWVWRTRRCKNEERAKAEHDSQRNIQVEDEVGKKTSEKETEKNDQLTAPSEPDQALGDGQNRKKEFNNQSGH